MIFKRFELGLLVRFGLLLGMMYLTLQVLVHFTWLQVGTGILVMLLQVWELAQYVTRSNNELAKFLQAVKHRDFSQHFNENSTNSALRELHKSFNLINRTYKELHLEQEAQFQYMQTILKMIDTGILALNKDSEVVEWVNDAFKKILGIPHLRNLNALQQRYPSLHDAVTSIKAGESRLLKVKLPNSQGQLLLTATGFTMQGQQVLLLGLKNVSATVDATETEAWQKLLRVMTHEIMNSVAPIASLADTLGKHLRSELSQHALNPEIAVAPDVLQDTEEGISIIKKRSEGLLRFAHFYRNFNKSQELMLTTVYVEELLNSIQGLMLPQLEQQQVQLTCQVNPPNLAILGDVNLLEQVLINLVLNAKRAVQGRPNPYIELYAHKHQDKVIIEVRDNGAGIPEELLDSIFIPFFTSHKDGSGIGLSLAKHIMLLHRGSIQVESQEGVGTLFRLVF